jgi:DNA-binding NarL/FixJ family response regulator
MSALSATEARSRSRVHREREPPSLLCYRFEVVGEASDGTEAVALTMRERPDVVLMDLHIPDLDGASATAEIRARRPETQILVLTPTTPTRTSSARSTRARSGTSSRTFLTRKSAERCERRLEESR